MIYIIAEKYIAALRNNYVKLHNRLNIAKATKVKVIKWAKRVSELN